MMMTMMNRDDLLARARSGRTPSLQKSSVWLRRCGGRPATLSRSLLRWQAAQLTAYVCDNDDSDHR